MLVGNVSTTMRLFFYIKDILLGKCVELTGMYTESSLLYGGEFSCFLLQVTFRRCSEVLFGPSKNTYTFNRLKSCRHYTQYHLPKHSESPNFGSSLFMRLSTNHQPEVWGRNLQLGASRRPMVHLASHRRALTLKPYITITGVVLTLTDGPLWLTAVTWSQ